MNRKLKGAMKSKSMWLGFVTTVLGAAYETIPEVRSLIQPKYFGPLLMILGISYQAFRYITNQALEEK